MADFNWIFFNYISVEGNVSNRSRLKAGCCGYVRGEFPEVFYLSWYSFSLDLFLVAFQCFCWFWHLCVVCECQDHRLNGGRITVTETTYCWSSEYSEQYYCISFNEVKRPKSVSSGDIIHIAVTTPTFLCVLGFNRCRFNIRALSYFWLAHWDMFSSNGFVIYEK